MCDLLSELIRRYQQKSLDFYSFEIVSSNNKNTTSTFAAIKAKMRTSNGKSPILVLALACFFQVSWAKNFDRMVLGQVYLEEFKETPPRMLLTGDCVEYIFPRSHNGIFGK